MIRKRVKFLSEMEKLRPFTANMNKQSLNNVNNDAETVMHKKKYNQESMLP